MNKIQKEILLAYGGSQVKAILPGNEYYCETCAQYRYKDRKDVYQVEKDETCLYACCTCHFIVLEGEALPVVF